ncbi:MAG: 50S ribosomal protein P1 [Candidatus Bathyarchaeota archaeon]|nr:50S ribosomal protein P1 [Candidatus Bathyarchaeota archaeon]
MEYIYAAMLLHKAGKEINEENLTQVLTAAGINVDTVRIKALMASLAEVDIEEAIKSAPTMMAAPAAPAVAPAAEAKPTGEEKKKKEEEEKAKEEAALEGLGALFG